MRKSIIRKLKQIYWEKFNNFEIYIDVFYINLFYLLYLFLEELIIFDSIIFVILI
jgi:hypothetical protein